MPGEYASLEPASLQAFVEDCAHAGHVQAEAFQQQQREEQRRLMLGYPAGQSTLGVALAFGEGEQLDVQVGIVVLVIGVGVMAIVLLDPPRIAETDEPTMKNAHDIVGPQVAEDLPMYGVVSDERKLAKHHGEE